MKNSKQIEKQAGRLVAFVASIMIATIIFVAILVAKFGIVTLM